MTSRGWQSPPLQLVFSLLEGRVAGDFREWKALEQRGGDWRRECKDWGAGMRAS